MSDIHHHVTRVTAAHHADIGCDVCFDLLDVYAEATRDGRDADRLVPGMAEHLAGCPTCDEEFRSLIDLLAEDAADPPL